MKAYLQWEFLISNHLIWTETVYFFLLYKRHGSNNKTMLLSDTVHQTSREESAVAGLTAQIYTVLFLSRHVTNAQIQSIFTRAFDIA